MKWKADLAEMDRSSTAMEGNFDLLFYNLNKSKIPLDTALQYLDRAIKAHYPSEYVLKSVYKHMKKNGSSAGSLQDFEESWKEHISGAAKRVFFSIYNIDDTETKGQTKFGNMSASEYRKQQKYADSHPTLDWESLIREQEQKISSVPEDKGPSVDPGQVDININLGDL
jgi:hypothetical protein